jgi:uncharacterized protein (DUF1330 family)
MTAYAIAHFVIEDEERYQQYADAFFPIFRRYNGRFLAFDDGAPIIEGSAPPGRTVLLSFDDKETAHAWYNDPDYQEIAKHRHAGTRPVLLTIIGERPEGWAGP